ncbi:PefC/AfrB family outer membrane usher protein [Photobacterium leiognathi]|nr:PefC/AfrB family outer membrane usher protein [Photobacterium leiognathi]
MNKKNRSLKLNKITYSFSLIFASLFYGNVKAETELDFSFIQGKNTQIPEVLKKSPGNVPGNYLLDIIFNNKRIGKKSLTITKDEIQNLCLSSDWITSLDLPINFSKIKKSYDKNKGCYNLSLNKGSTVQFNYNKQELKINIPQYYMLNNSHLEKWDYGSTGFRLNYALNANKSFNKSTSDISSLYGNFDLNANYGEWVFNTKVSALSNEGIESPDLTLSKAIKSVHGDFIIGKSITQSAIISDFSFYGASLRSNASMQPWLNRGYAPVINGVLNSNALVTIKQGEYILYSKNLPAGPYSITDLAPVSNGDLTVNVEENNGNKSSTTYPVTTLPTLLRTGDFNYNFATGIRSNSINNDGIFGLASLDYGFNFGTANIATIIHPKYQSIGSGLSIPINNLGAISASINMALSHYDQSIDGDQTGVSATLKYAKDFGENTNLQLLSYRYTGKGYTDFSDFNAKNIVDINENKSSRYEIQLNQNLGSSYLNMSGWRQDYRNGGNDIGVNLSLSGTVKGVSIGFNNSYSKTRDKNYEYNSSLNVNIPFNLFEKNQVLNSSVNYNSNSGTSFNNGTSLIMNDNLSTTANLNVAKNQNTASIYTSVKFNNVQTNFSVSQSNNSTTIATSASGTVAGTKKTGLVFSNEQQNTIAIAHIKDMKGIRFNNSSKTNDNGNTIIPLSSYQKNNIAIDTNNIPEDIELLNTNYSITPTNKAIIVRDYNYIKVSRYLLRILSKNGEPIPMGTEITTDKDLTVGVVANNGVVLISLFGKNNNLKLKINKDVFNIDLKNINPGIEKVKNIKLK